MDIGVITLFPEMFDGLKWGVIGRAIDKQLINIKLWNPRDFTTDKHKTVDDRPYGGGPGMLMKVQPLQEAIKIAKMTLGDETKIIALSPKGHRFTQAAALEFSQQASPLLFVSGRYEGIDERLIETEIDEIWSIGDFVLSGGELAAMVMIDAITRLLPDVLGDEESAKQDSFMQGLLDHPHYTRPENVSGLEVPEVLLKGDHQAIAKWRLKQALGHTWLHRPDMLMKLHLDLELENLLNEFIKELGNKT